MYGQKRTSKSGVAGYGGLFWGSVRNNDGTKLNGSRLFNGKECPIDSAEDYFFEMEDNGESASDIINNELHCHLQKHIGNVGHDKYHWQCGFGGDEMDGLLDFWLPNRIECPPNMPFTILGNTYVMSFHYCGDKSGFSSEEEN